MRLSAARALGVFADAYGPGLDLDRAATAIVALLEALAGPATVNEIRKRQLDTKARPFFAAFERDTGITKAELTAPAIRGGGAGNGAGTTADPLTTHREAFAKTLVGSSKPRFSLGEVAEIMGRSREAVRRLYAKSARTEARSEAATVVVLGERTDLVDALDESMQKLRAAGGKP